MPDDALIEPRLTPVIYVTDLTFAHFDPADLFDLAYLLRSPNYVLTGVCLADPERAGERVVSAVADAVGKETTILRGADGLSEALESAPEPVNLVVVGGYSSVQQLLETNRPLFRKSVARVFLVGGYANVYGSGERPADRKLPTDPRMEQRNPERFTALGDPRVSGHEQRSWSALLLSGEAIIWLPRDICLWRYAAPQVLADGGGVSALLTRELFFANLSTDRASDRYAAAAMPVLLSALPALLLAVQPDPFAWMRLFRAVAMRVRIDANGTVDIAAGVADPNVYAVVAIDGLALGKLLTAQLRDRPLTSV